MMAGLIRMKNPNTGFSRLDTFSDPGSGTIVVPAGASRIEYAELYGGGGGGTLGGNAGKNGTKAGSGGKGGACVVLENLAVVPGMSIPYTVGAGGAAATSSNTQTGGNGTSTLLDFRIVANNSTAYLEAGGGRGGMISTDTFNSFASNPGGNTTSGLNVWAGWNSKVPCPLLAREGADGGAGANSGGTTAGGNGGAAGVTTNYDTGASQHHSGGLGGTGVAGGPATEATAPGGGGAGGDNTSDTATTGQPSSGQPGRIYIKWS